MTAYIIASFISPMNIATTPQALLWLLPLSLAISVAYKAMKLPKITWKNFLKEITGLFASIIVFMILIGLALMIFDYLILQKSIF
mgnify:CR=1 FL=1